MKGSWSGWALSLEVIRQSELNLQQLSQFPKRQEDFDHDLKALFSSSRQQTDPEAFAVYDQTNSIALC